jgi:hypothetical protein
MEPLVKEVNYRVKGSEKFGTMVPRGRRSNPAVPSHRPP